MKKPIFALAGLLVLPLGVLADDIDEDEEYEDNYRPFSYTFVEGAYAHAELDGSDGDDDFDEDGDGYKVAASLALTDHIFLFGDYADISFDSPLDDATRWGGGLGLNIPLGVLPIDVVLKGGYADFELDTDVGIEFEDEGFMAGAGLRIGLGDFVEIQGGATYYDVDSPFEDTVFDAAARFYITDALALKGGVEFDEDFDTPIYLVGLRFEFGRLFHYDD